MHSNIQVLNLILWLNTSIRPQIILVQFLKADSHIGDQTL